ncbi:hypothetical protein PENTCL1PPCAC_19245, partial [Pristionchus entomophagus]
IVAMLSRRRFSGVRPLPSRPSLIYPVGREQDGRSTSAAEKLACRVYVLLPSHPSFPFLREKEGSLLLPYSSRISIYHEHCCFLRSRLFDMRTGISISRF